MRLHFKTNDYLLTWNLLYGASFSQSVHNFKTKLYKTHKRQYKSIQKDMKEMLSDIKNFIPDDETLYNYVFETELFVRLKEDTDRHRLELLKIWDQNKKAANDILKQILKLNFKEDYSVVVLHPVMDTVLVEKGSTTIGWGTKKDLVDPLMTLTNIIYTVVRNETYYFEKKYQDIVNAVLELAIGNEFYARLSGKSAYLKGDNSLTYLKRQIYPYWLMYLGCEKEDFTSYMMRDKVSFDIDKYKVEKELRNLNLLEFIEFCIQNQFKIIRINQLEII